MHGECQAEHGHRAGVGRRPARDASARGAAADHERQPAQRAVAKLLDDRHPRLVEPPGGGGRAPACHQVGLLHEHNGEPLRLGHLGHSDEVARGHSPTRAVAEHERTHRVLRRMDVSPREAMRRLEFEGARSWRFARSRFHALAIRDFILAPSPSLPRCPPPRGGGGARGRRVERGHVPVFGRRDAARRHSEAVGPPGERRRR